MIAYLDSRSRRRPTTAASGMGGLGPVSEGLFAWLVGIGGLVGFAVWIAAHTTRARTRSKRWSSTSTDGEDRVATPTTARRRRDAEPIANPGLPAHQWRPTDVDPKAEKRAERQVAALFVPLDGLRGRCSSSPTSPSTIGDDLDTFVGLGASNLALGLTLGGALLLIGIGVIQWARKLMADHEIVEMRHPAASPRRGPRGDARGAQRRARGVRHRPPPAGPQLAARRDRLCSLPAVVLLRDLGPLPGRTISSSTRSGSKGMRVVRDVVGTPIKASDLEIGDLINAEPEALFDDRRERRAAEVEGVELQVAKAKGAIILVRMEPDDITPGRGPRELDRRRHHLLLQDLHPRGLPDLPVRADHPPPAVPVPPVDLRPRRRRPRSSSARPPAPSPSCPSRSTRRATWSRRATSTSPSDRASGSVTAMSIDTSKVATATRHRRDGQEAGRPAPWPTGPTSASASPRRRRSSCARSSPTTGPSCSARSRCGASSSCCSPASS